jgi:hypothetical protein
VGSTSMARLSMTAASLFLKFGLEIKSVALYSISLTWKEGAKGLLQTLLKLFRLQLRQV